ncbi:hypothetical protein BN159_3859 [Streptomyces davaonensis JCM 4913]|uniref:Uncharacterized protein n=1 Tax=Streptomyces davaonensis (strain DSM 101723 / JCM 4913 / KCC S-0913 / 768) TaxID=1214101 RepID=K4R4H3_STRDJ|nr:hypothetical protein [Streptomyces davaonensis]CCK28238.1 hypothetical protein BN159_3859 [Streptomyces davaonensis JCM 4913]
MPSVDGARRRVRLADAHVSVLGLLVEEGQIPDELAQARAELREGGILEDDDKIVADLYPLVATLMEPHVIARVEVTGPGGVTQSGAVVGDDFIFTHENWPGEAESEYVPAEPETLVWALARMVDLHRDFADGGDHDEVITSTMGAFDGVIARMEAGQLEPPAVADAAGAPVRMAEVLSQLNCMWRMTVVWKGDETQKTLSNGLAVSALAVWDCGIEGYWLRELPAEPTVEGQVDENSELRVRRTSAKELWQMITDLLPDGAQLVSTGQAQPAS